MRPVVFAFLPEKSQALYVEFFTLLRNKMSDLGLQFTATRAVLDFETAAHNAIRRVFPDVDTKGCLSTSPRACGGKPKPLDFRSPTMKMTT